MSPKKSRLRQASTLAGLLATSSAAFVACGGDEPEAPNVVSAGSATACAVLATLQSKCTSCHADLPTAGAPMPLTSLEALRAKSMLFPNTTVAERVLVRMRDERAPMPPQGRAGNDETGQVASWIAEGMPACASGVVPNERHPNLIPQEELFKCQEGTLGSSPARLRRMARPEWRYSMPNRNGLAGWGDKNPLDPNTEDLYSTYASDETMDDAVLDAFLDPSYLGGRAGDEMISHLSLKIADRLPALRCILTAAKPDAACVSAFVAELLPKHVLFREATPAELARTVDFTNVVLAEETSLAGRQRSLSRVANAAWLTTGAIFRAEFGAPDVSKRNRLSNWELAQQLAYAISDRGPGAPRQTYALGAHTEGFDGHLAKIAAAAADGSIQRPEVRAALLKEYGGGVDPTRFDLADKLSQYDRETHGMYWTSDKVAGFFREWLGYSAFPTAFKDQPAKTSVFQPSGNKDVYDSINTSYSNLQVIRYLGNRPNAAPVRETHLIAQFDDMIARTVVGDRNVLENLLSTRQYYVAATWPTYTATQQTQRPYGIATDVPDTREGRWVTLPANERAGVLSHPGWLASHGGNFEDDPSLIHRGKWVRENILCQYVPPLSEVQVDAKVPPSHPQKTARMRVDEATQSAECQGCHKLMNPLGYPFEIYNHAGFLRAVDHDGSPPNGRSTLVDMPDPALNGPVRDAVELSEKFSRSPYVKRCFIRQSFRYFMGRSETRADACSLVQMERAYDVQGSYYAMVNALFSSDVFLYRHLPKAGEK
jgi:hypothetical protein